MRTLSFLGATALLALVGCGDDASPADDGGVLFDARIADASADAGPDARVDAAADAALPDAGPGECGDGIDNDGDGLVDWEEDLGCFGPADTSEAALSREQEEGWTTFDVGGDSLVIYVSNEGDDANDGLSPENAVATLERGAALVRDGENDFLLLRRGDVWRDETLYRFKSGADAEHPLVIASYGESLVRPRIEFTGEFLNHDGRRRDYVALVGLHFYAYELDPENPDFNEAGGSPILRYIGGGDDLLIEGCHFEYAGFVTSSFGEEHYHRTEFRRNVVERHYHADTCETGSTYRPSGVYASHVDALVIEENLFDHNGWNADEVSSACATIYNHNAYLNGTDMRIVGNVFSRASSIQIKMRSDTAGDVSGLLIEDNFFVEGEVGLSIGGNSEDAYRFVDTTVRGNVFTDVGRGQPTGRTLAWTIELFDNDGATVEDNLILNQRTAGVGNSFGLNLARTARNYSIRDNLFYRLQGTALQASSEHTADSVVVESNTFVAPAGEVTAGLLIRQSDFTGFTYSGNTYYSDLAAGDWFRLDSNTDLAGWEAASSETGATALSEAPSFSDPERDLERYASSIGAGSTLAEFIEVARLQSRLSWREDLTAAAINAYIRAGFDR